MDIIAIPTPGATETEVQGVVDAAESSILAATKKPWYDRNPIPQGGAVDVSYSNQVSDILIIDVGLGSNLMLHSVVIKQQCITTGSGVTAHQFNLTMLDDSSELAFTFNTSVDQIITAGDWVYITIPLNMLMGASWRLYYDVFLEAAGGSWKSEIRYAACHFDL